MGQTLSFREMLSTYRLEDRTLFALVEKGDVFTLRFDLYHTDDRCKGQMKYLLDVAIYRRQLRFLGGAGRRLHESFSADILAAELVGDELRLVVDCSFYVKRIATSLQSRSPAVQLKSKSTLQPSGPKLKT